MKINRVLVFSILASAIAAGCAGPRWHKLVPVRPLDASCDDGRRGLLGITRMV
jgi:hypothetical protein